MAFAASEYILYEILRSMQTPSANKRAHIPMGPKSICYLLIYGEIGLNPLHYLRTEIFHVYLLIQASQKGSSSFSIGVSQSCGSLLDIYVPLNILRCICLDQQVSATGLFGWRFLAEFM